MMTRIQRWGNSLAVRIPKAFAEQTELDENSDVRISVEGDKIVISPARQEWTLDALTRKITPSNRHRETPWGDRTGRETW